MSFSYLNNDGDQYGFSVILGQKWIRPEHENCPQFFKSIFEQVDNGDGIVQKEEVSLLKKLLNIADTLIQKKSNDKIIDDEEAKLLFDNIKNNVIDMDKLRTEAKGEEFPNAVDISSKLNCKIKSGYNVQLLNTNSQTKGYHRKVGKYQCNTYLLKFTDPNTDFAQEIKIHFNIGYDEDKILSIIEKLLDDFNNKDIDLLCGEINNLYVGKKMSPTTADFFWRDNESVTWYPPFNLYVLRHELGHAKDFLDGGFSGKSQKLFDMLQDLNCTYRNNPDYFLTKPTEMYAEFFNSYTATYHDAEEIVNNKYGEIFNRLPNNEKDKFLQVLTNAVLFEEDTTIEVILEKAGLEKYKEAFQDCLSEKIKVDIPKHSVSEGILKIIKKYTKKNPAIWDEYCNLMKQVGDDYCNSRNCYRTEDI